VKTAFFFAAVLACWPVGAAEPVMSGPTEAEPREYVRLEITDLPVESLADAVLIVWPEAGTELLPIRTWGGEPLMLFRAVRPGEYLVQVVVPVLDGKVAKLLQVRHTITVRGPPPPVVVVPPAPPIPPPLPPGPDPPMPPPTPETSGVAYLIVVRNNQDLTADQASTLIHLRQWSDSQPAKVSHLEISPDAGGSDSRLKTYIDKAGQLPWVIISQGRTDGNGAAVLWSGPLPDSHDALIGTFQEVVK
jgi:hypothetical protein